MKNARAMVLASVVTGCAAAPAKTDPQTAARTATPAVTEPQRETVPTYRDLPVYVRPIAQSSAEVRAAWAAFEHVRDHALPQTQTPTTEWARQVTPPWIEEHKALFVELFTRLAPLSAKDEGEDALFATLLIAWSMDDFSAKLEHMVPLLTGNDTPVDTSRVRRARMTARPALQRCVDLAPSAPSSMQPWAAACGEMLASLPEPTAEERDQHLPPECRGDEDERDPEAPPPVSSARLEVAVVYESNTLTGARRQQFVTAVRQKLARLETQLAFIPVADVRAAEDRRARRMNTAGRVCAQGASLGMLLAARHTNLVFASVSTECASMLEEDGSAQPPLCALTVNFWRPGAPDDHNGLPDSRSVRVPTPSPDAWMAAVSQLAAQQSSGVSDVLGALNAGPQVRVFGTFDDPFLRVAPTLREARDALGACRTQTTMQPFQTEFTLGADGRVTDVKVSAVRATDDESARQAACVERVIRATGFRCTANGAPVRVTANVCLAASPFTGS